MSSSSKDGVHGAPKAPNSNMNSNRALKARTAIDNYAQATKRPTWADHLSDEVIISEPGASDQVASHPEGDDEEDDDLCHSARWQASEELFSFLGTLHKLLFTFVRKAITRKYPPPDVDFVYTFT